MIEIIIYHIDRSFQLAYTNRVNEKYYQNQLYYTKLIEMRE